MISHLNHPPGQDGEAGHGPGGQELPVAPPEQRAGQAPELGLGPGLVHQLDVLVPPDTQQPGERANQSDPFRSLTNEITDLRQSTAVKLGRES